jgi:hypothetical protein
MWCPTDEVVRHWCSTLAQPRQPQQGPPQLVVVSPPRQRKQQPSLCQTASSTTGAVKRQRLSDAVIQQDVLQELLAMDADDDASDVFAAASGLWCQQQGSATALGAPGPAAPCGCGSFGSDGGLAVTFATAAAWPIATARPIAIARAVQLTPGTAIVAAQPSRRRTTTPPVVVGTAVRVLLAPNAVVSAPLLSRVLPIDARAASAAAWPAQWGPHPPPCTLPLSERPPDIAATKGGCASCTPSLCSGEACESAPLELERVLLGRHHGYRGAVGGEAQQEAEAEAEAEARMEAESEAGGWLDKLLLERGAGPCCALLLAVTPEVGGGEPAPVSPLLSVTDVWAS